MSSAPDQPLSPILPAKLHWRDNGTPQSIDYDDVYFSEQDGLAETRYVFLQQNNLPARWKNLPADRAGVFVIAETGFGTGLNFLAAWQLWQASAPRSWRLQFLSFEKHPLTRPDLQRALQQWPQLAALSESLIDQYPALVPGLHAIDFPNDEVSLHLYFGDAVDAMQQWHGNSLVDAWFLDGFAPAKNPGMWSETLFAELRRLSKPGCSFATFTAVGAVRRNLQDMGFRVEKHPGFGRKREMLRGVLTEEAGPVASEPPRRFPAWAQLPASRPADNRQVLVIGGGLAGCSSANALARRGWQVLLLEKRSTLAGAASGNTQGVLYTKLSHDFDQHAQFNTLSFQYALRHYGSLFQRGYLKSPEDGELCGVLQLAFDDKEAHRQQQIARAYYHDRHFCQPVSTTEASQLASVSVEFPGLYYPSAGWLNPENLCRYWSTHRNINIRLNHDVAEIVYDNGIWHALDSGGQSLASASHIVVANAAAARNFSQLGFLPGQSIRGQISEWRYTQAATAPQLQCVVCHEGYVTPALHGIQRLGATFTLNNNSTRISAADHEENWSKLQQFLPRFAEQIPAPNTLGDSGQDGISLGGRVAFRCTSPDYMPMVGPVPDVAQFLEDYGALRNNARQTIPTPGQYLPGLYVNIAHASRGLSSTPLCAELLAAQLSAETLPLSFSNSVALNPARFLIRDLIRRRI